MQLAREGGVSQREIRSRYSSRELQEQLVYDGLELRGDALVSYWMSMIASILINSHRKPGSEPVKPEELLPEKQRRRLELAREPQTPEQMEMLIKGIVAARGGTISDGKNDSSNPQH